MVNKLVVSLTLVLICNISNSQNKHPERFISLIDFEYNTILKDLPSNIPDGRYYTSSKYKDGKIKSIQTIGYKNQKKHGESLTFKKALGIMFVANVTNYFKGKREGYYFDTDNHTFSEEGYYKNGKKHGFWKIRKNDFFENIHYQNGLKSGNYSSQDNLLGKNSTGQYKKNRKENVWFIEDTNTGEITKETYKKGKLISTEILDSLSD